ncbi:hypothetical protein Anapl_09930 [Anas platyrhynchos]|uniref:Uncharacterized protein n=1 Tax=Anas platyrhynchos TaxID=8839 RepID=R0JL76_ANAPL|nr:hypothetical protein Anapl_09930 [Anas platyrhynchos]
MVLKSKECGKSSFIERLLLTQMAPTAQFAHLMHAGSDGQSSRGNRADAVIAQRRSTGSFGHYLAFQLMWFTRGKRNPTATRTNSRTDSSERRRQGSSPTSCRSTLLPGTASFFQSHFCLNASSRATFAQITTTFKQKTSFPANTDHHLQDWAPVDVSTSSNWISPSWALPGISSCRLELLLSPRLCRCPLRHLQDLFRLWLRQSEVVTGTGKAQKHEFLYFFNSFHITTTPGAELGQEEEQDTDGPRGAADAKGSAWTTRTMEGNAGAALAAETQGTRLCRCCALIHELESSRRLMASALLTQSRVFGAPKKGSGGRALFKALHKGQRGPSFAFSPWGIAGINRVFSFSAKRSVSNASQPSSCSASFGRGRALSDRSGGEQRALKARRERGMSGLVAADGFQTQKRSQTLPGFYFFSENEDFILQKQPAAERLGWSLRGGSSSDLCGFRGRVWVSSSSSSPSDLDVGPRPGARRKTIAFL